MKRKRGFLFEITLEISLNVRWFPSPQTFTAITDIYLRQGGCSSLPADITFSFSFLLFSSDSPSPAFFLLKFRSDWSSSSEHSSSISHLFPPEPSFSTTLELLQARVASENGKLFELHFKYEGLPKVCFVCGMLTHSTNDCEKSPVIENGREQLQFGSWLQAPKLDHKGNPIKQSARKAFRNRDTKNSTGTARESRGEGESSGSGKQQGQEQTENLNHTTAATEVSELVKSINKDLGTEALSMAEARRNAVETPRDMNEERDVPKSYWLDAQDQKPN